MNKQAQIIQKNRKEELFNKYCIAVEETDTSISEAIGQLEYIFQDRELVMKFPFLTQELRSTNKMLKVISEFLMSHKQVVEHDVDRV